jgi:hypothetical protein
MREGENGPRCDENTDRHLGRLVFEDTPVEGVGRVKCNIYIFSRLRYLRYQEWGTLKLARRGASIDRRHGVFMTRSHL